MREENELCVCFHVSQKKLKKFIRLKDPQVVSQCSECYGAGTGCGWCIPFIEKLFEEIKSGTQSPDLSLDPAEYRARRLEYIQRTKNDKMKPAEPTGPDTPEDEPDALVDQLLDI